MDRDKQFFIRQMSRAVGKAAKGRAEFAHTTPLPDEKPISLLAQPRIIVSLSGAMPISYSDGQAVRRAVFPPGVFFYAPPYGWSHPAWDKPVEFISMVFHPEHLRFVHVRHDGGPADPNGPTRGKRIYHTSSAPSQPLSLLVAVANAYAEEPAANARHALDALVLLLREGIGEIARDAPMRQGKSYLLWRDIRQDLREHSHLPRSREEVARSFGVTPSYLSRLFANHGEGFNDYLFSLRMTQALHLLTHTRIPVKEIAWRTGFHSANYFIRRFTGRYGVTPGAYRAKPPDERA